MKNHNHFVMNFISHFNSGGGGVILILFCPKGCSFSLSGVSAESEKKNQLCVLCISSGAGGDKIPGFDRWRNLKLSKVMTSENNCYPSQPVVAVGAIIFRNNRVLLVRRGQPPSQDLWAIPGGRVEIGETLQEAAEREILEETGITIHAREPVYTFDYIEQDGSASPRFHYVIIDLTADYVGGEIMAGDDAAEARWIAADELAGLKVSSKTLKLLKKQFGFG